MNKGPFKIRSKKFDGFALRRLTKADASSCARMLAASDPWKRMNYRAEDLEGYLLRCDPALNKFVFTVEGKLAGVICVREPWLKGPYLELFSVFEGFRSNGLGGRVLGWFEDSAFRTSKNAWILVSSFNQHALRFYNRHGFDVVAPLPGLVREGFDELLLRKARPG